MSHLSTTDQSADPPDSSGLAGGLASNDRGGGLRRSKGRERAPRPPRTALTLSVLVLGGLGLCILAVGIGSASIAPQTVAQILGYRLSGWGDPTNWTLTQDDIVWNLRLPRVLLALLVGASLATVGVVAQAVMRNPLADPYVLGISSGAALGAVSWLVLGSGHFGGSSVGIASTLR